MEIVTFLSMPRAFKKPRQKGGTKQLELQASRQAREVAGVSKYAPSGPSAEPDEEVVDDA
jgi:hypothetical protein